MKKNVTKFVNVKCVKNGVDALARVRKNLMAVNVKINAYQKDVNANK